MPRKRELIEPHPGDKRFVRRDDKGRFHTSVSLTRSLSDDDRKNAHRTTAAGYGDKGDRHTRSRH